MAPAPSRILVPVRYGAWLQGDLGATIQRSMEVELARRDANVTRFPRAVVVEAPEAWGVLLEAVHRAVLAVERQVQAAYPVFHHEMGPVWTGTLQAIFESPSEAASPAAVGSR